MRRKLAAGNWKMNGLLASLTEIKTLASLPQTDCEVLICPPVTLIHAMAEICQDTAVLIGAQDCHAAECGAHTGDISAQMLHEAGAKYVILGHSERRGDHGESDELIRQKTLAAWSADLTAIVCVGESEQQRLEGTTLDIIGAQLAASIPDGATAENLVVAYEPIWAIGTGRVPTLGDIAQVHDFMRKTLSNRFGDIAANVRLLYGGSMNPGNVAEISGVSNVDGGLVGGASLKAQDFAKIISALGQ
ncbi:MAG: triose-phosphate isomerase [Alphaproteobacteria bacterium]|nr:triose-phosphate isomerase [Alphaproteobacteria bacterium]